MNKSKNKSFIVDSSATSHMIKDVGNFFHIKLYDENDVIYVRAGNSPPISHNEYACVLTNEGKLDLKDVLVIPNLMKKKKKWLSIGKFTTNNLCTFKFSSSIIIVKNQNQRTVVKGYKKG